MAVVNYFKLETNRPCRCWTFSPAQKSSELAEKGLEEDHFTAACLRGILPEDGEGAGTPFYTMGDGNCLFNAISSQIVSEKKLHRRMHPVRKMSTKLRVGVVLAGLKYMELFLAEYGNGFYQSWYNYSDDVRVKLEKAGWTLMMETSDDMRVATPECARLMFVAQLHHIARDGVWLQQFVFPLLSTVIQAPLRVFFPCEIRDSMK